MIKPASPRERPANVHRSTPRDRRGSAAAHGLSTHARDVARGGRRDLAHRVRRVLALLLVVGLSAISGTSWATDYDPQSDDWNGTQELVRIAQRAEVELRPERTLDWDGVRRGDGLLVLYPQATIDLSDVSAFLEDGGRLALLDDFGESASALRWFQVQRDDRVRGDPRVAEVPGVLTAYRQIEHPLSEGVDALVTNEPVTLFHAQLSPVFSLSPDPHSGIVLVGQVGRGRLVVGGDPSVLINTMMRFAGNRQFARNLLLFLAGGSGGRVHVIYGPFRTRSSYASRVPSRSPLRELVRRVDQGLVSAQQLVSGPLGARFVALALALVAVVTLGLRIWGSRPSDRFGPAAPPGPTASVADKAWVFARRSANMLYPSLVAKRFFERRLLRAAGLRSPTDLTVVLEQLRGRIDRADERAVRSIVLELDRLATPREEGGPERISARTFLSLWKRISAILPRLEARTE